MIYCSTIIVIIIIIIISIHFFLSEATIEHNNRAQSLGLGLGFVKSLFDE